MLRSFDIPLSYIKEVKKSLSQVISFKGITKQAPFREMIDALVKDSGEQKKLKNFYANPDQIAEFEHLKFSLIEVIVFDSIITQSHWSVCINEKQEVFVYKPDALEIFMENPAFDEFISGSFIQVGFHDILNEFVAQKPKELVFSYAMVSLDEAEVLNAVREEDLKSVLVTFNNKSEIDLIKTTFETKIERADLLAKIIRSDGYQEITIKTQDGVVSHCLNTVSKKLQHNEK